MPSVQDHPVSFGKLSNENDSKKFAPVFGEASDDLEQSQHESDIHEEI